jgi:hypothetical protein
MERTKERTMSNQEYASGEQVSCNSLLADWFRTFEAFIGQCDDLAKDIAEKNPFGEWADGKRMKLLVDIAREWHNGNASGKKAPCVSLLAASVALRDYLESAEAICCTEFDIPDHLWVPFQNAIKAEESANKRTLEAF